MVLLRNVMKCNVELWKMICISVFSICYKISMLFSFRQEYIQAGISGFYFWLTFFGSDIQELWRGQRLRFSCGLKANRDSDMKKHPLHQMSERMSMWGGWRQGEELSHTHTHMHTQNNKTKQPTQKTTNRHKCSILFSNNTAWMRPSPSVSKNCYSAKGTWLVEATCVFAWKKDTASLKD